MSVHAQYVKNNVEGMSRDELVLFVYAELIKELHAARQCFQTGDIEKRVTAINRGLEIISTLLGTLDFSAGPLAVQLRSLYLYAMGQLTRANCDRRPEMVAEVAQIFRGLHDAWRQKMDQDQGKGRVVIPENAPAPRSGEAGKLEFYG